MKKILTYIVFALTAFYLAGCQQELISSDGEEICVTLCLDSAPETIVGNITKVVPDNVTEGDEANYMVSDFWLFQYNTNGVLTGKPRYYENAQDGVNVSVFRPSSGTYKCYIIANTHNPGFLSEIGEYATEAELRRAYKSVADFSDLWQKGTADGASDLLMSGVIEVTSTTSDNLSCTLKRNVAKLTLNINNGADSQITLNTIQIKNVSDHLFYADVMFDGAPAPSPTEAETGFVNMGVTNIDLGSGNNLSKTFYLPRNMKGESGSASNTSDKNRYAPNTATYVEIMATNDNTGTSLRYRFYLGKNMLTNFDVEPNYHYVLPITFSSKGSDEDSRVEDMGMIHLADANSFIIQPLSTAAQSTYSVPVHERVNKFWDSIEGRKLGVEYKNYFIEEDTEWTAEIIWQDTPEKVLLFCDENGKEFTDGLFATKGQEPLYFRPTQAAFNIDCNVLIGVKKKGGSNYLWSWHIWITDYNPDQYPGPWVENQHSYAVDGGHLHRYGHTYWKQNLTGKYIMDRNLGARSAKRDDGLMNNAGLGYQYGRKDPFTMVIGYKFYNSKGEEIFFDSKAGTTMRPMRAAKGPAYMYQSIWNPVTFYTDSNDASEKYDDWMLNKDLYMFSWNDIDGKTFGKSFFDPCPPGWKIPENGTYNQFTLEKNIEDSWRSGPTVGWDLYMGETGNSETIFFPIAGWRNLSNGAIGYNQSAATSDYMFTRLWTTACDIDSGFYLHLGRNNSDKNFSPNISYSGGNFRSYGFSVRCIQE